MSALVMAIVVISGLFMLPASVFNPLALLLMLGGLWEWRRLCHASMLAFSLGALVMVSLFGAYTLDQIPHSVTYMLFALGVLSWLLQTLNLSKPLGQGKSLCLFKGVFLLGLAWLSMVSLRDEFGPHTLMLVLLMVWSADTFAYFGGKRFGKTKLAPNISPGKTREGVASGVLMSMVVAVAYQYWFIAAPTSLSEFVALLCVTLLVALISVVGDLSESKLKRAAGMKDSGSLIPGHGGILDRIDGLIAGIVVYAFYAFVMPAFI